MIEPTSKKETSYKLERYFVVVANIYLSSNIAESANKHGVD